MTKISVLIPVYNGCKYIEKAMQSVIDQTYGNWEIIVLDDESSDDSLIRINTLARTDSRIKVISKKNDGNGNTAINMKIMYEYAEGDYFFYMSQDDWISTDLFENAAKRIDETDAEVVIPDMLLANADGSVEATDCTYPPNNDHSIILKGEEAFYLSIDFSINGFAFIQRKLMLDARCDTRFFDSDEYNTRMQFLWSKRVAFCTGSFFYYQGNDNAITKKFSAKQFQRLDTAFMLSESFRKVFTSKDKLLKMNIWLMYVYVNLVLSFFKNAKSIKQEEYNEIVDRLKSFERRVKFNGYRCGILHNTSKSATLLALSYFCFGTGRYLMPLYKMYSSLKKEA